METFLRDAERILETAAAARCDSPEYVICVARTGSLHILSDMTGWSLPALALELGAAALYRVERRAGTVQVEGWSYGRKCILSRDSAQPGWSGNRRGGSYATLQLVEGSGASQNDRAPQVRNS
ncbi:MAG TPA: hypothetical protein VKT49_17185 [Bryobacteraceae bacterium]|nr:hypothetical protein [Bryobacteraceae bacterium]